MRCRGLVGWSAPHAAPMVPPAAATKELPDLSNDDADARLRRRPAQHLRRPLRSDLYNPQIAAQQTSPADLGTKCDASDDWEGEYFSDIPKIKVEQRALLNLGVEKCASMTQILLRMAKLSKK